MDMIMMLDAVRRGDEATVGVKAANLGELLAAGLPVPAGFVVTVDARHAATDDVVPPPLVERLSTAYTRLAMRCGEREPRVAVRSSIAPRDGEPWSYIGVYDTVTNVRGVLGVATAIEQCWASQRAGRAQAYLALHDVADPPPMAVLVQLMVPSTLGGVACSHLPGEPTSGLLVVEAAYGQTTGVVSGLVQPDTYLVSRGRDHVVEVHLGTKAIEVVGSRLGEETMTVAPRRRHARALRSVDAARIARLLIQAEQHLGGAQQIEWAYDESTLRLLQSRPLVLGPSSPAGDVLGAVLATGGGAAPGLVAGPARVLDTPDEGELLRPGEVLVMTTPTPDWIPCLDRAAALVADRGGVTAHLAAICRELGTPCVVGTGTGSVTIRQGDAIVVDGAAGTVRVARPAPRRGRCRVAHTPPA